MSPQVLIFFWVWLFIYLLAPRSQRMQHHRFQVCWVFFFLNVCYLFCQKSEDQGLNYGISKYYSKHMMMMWIRVYEMGCSPVSTGHSITLVSSLQLLTTNVKSN